jgi:RNA polymerase sigma-70 factor (ECF subfamily)
MPDADPTDAATGSSAVSGMRRDFERQLLALVPDMRAFARFLAKNATDADDLVQDAVLRALKSYRQFTLGTNMKAWVFTILRNTRMNSLRRHRLETCLDEDAEQRPIPPNQLDSVELREVLAVLRTLSPTHCEVLTLVRASGLSYDEAAQVMQCKVGTIKSRINRADAALRHALGMNVRPPARLPDGPTAGQSAQY